MTVQSNGPDIDPANNGTLAGTLQFAIFKSLQNTDGMLPAKIISYDRSTNRAQVQLLIAMVTTSGIQVSRPQIASVPVMVFGGGGYFLSFKLNTGDLGWVIAADRDLSLFLQNYSEAAPNTYRIHNFADGIFIPDIMTGYTIASEDSDSVVLQNIAGTIKVSLMNDRIKLTSPLVEVTGDLQVDGMITGTGGMTLSGGSPNTLTATGDVRVVGEITASGNIIPFVP